MPQVCADVGDDVWISVVHLAVRERAGSLVLRCKSVGCCSNVRCHPGGCSVPGFLSEAKVEKGENAVMVLYIVVLARRYIANLAALLRFLGSNLTDFRFEWCCC